LTLCLHVHPSLCLPVAGPGAGCGRDVHWVPGPRVGHQRLRVPGVPLPLLLPHEPVGRLRVPQDHPPEHGAAEQDGAFGVQWSAPRESHATQPMFQGLFVCTVERGGLRGGGLRLILCSCCSSRKDTHTHLVIFGPCRPCPHPALSLSQPDAQTKKAFGPIFITRIDPWEPELRNRNYGVIG
jgi:hypothetical protein